MTKNKEYSLSTSDIQKLIPNATILSYDQLEGIDFASVCPLVILYLHDNHYGHWTLITRRKNTIEFFDSYGYKPDRQFEYVKNHKLNFKSFPYVCDGLIKCAEQGYKVEFNQYQFQKDGATCGRWVILRASLQDMDIDTFYKKIESARASARLSLDDLVCHLIPL